MPLGNSSETQISMPFDGRVVGEHTRPLRSVIRLSSRAAKTPYLPGFPISRGAEIMQLIFDIGMNNGDDTAYYLHKGYRVVAVEANPLIVEQAQQRFCDEIQRGRVEILNVGIGADRSEQEFYVSLKNSVWSSFTKAKATKGGGEYRALRVPCMRFKDLIDRFGTPHYAKIDIEGNDRFCLQDLETGHLPDFISVEMSHGDAGQDIDRLAGVGYVQFKCIRQNDFLSMTPGNTGLECIKRRILAALSGGVGRRINRWRFKKPADGTWRFPGGSSGMFGDDLAGEWLSASEVTAVWWKLRDVDRRLASGGLGEWFDIHARLAPRGDSGEDRDRLRDPRRQEGRVHLPHSQA